MCVTDCRYDAVREAALVRGWKLVDEDAGSTPRKCHVYWIDVPTISDRLQQLHPWQRINHFPGMSNVARKSRLARNLDRMRRSFPREFNFYPRTWVLPGEWGSFKLEFDAHGRSSRTFIIKPDSGCQGKGIYLTQDLNRVDPIESQVAQVYVRKPLLIEGLKFDLRVYVLVTSVDPLRVYVFKDGLARFCTEEYLRPSSDNLGERCMHLTNYAVNKGSDNFVANDAADRDDRGSKRSLRWLLEWVTAEHGEGATLALWRTICRACVKTLVSILPTLQREYLHTFGPDKHDSRITPGNGDPGEAPPGRRKGEDPGVSHAIGPPRECRDGDVSSEAGAGVSASCHATSAYPHGAPRQLGGEIGDQEGERHSPGVLPCGGLREGGDSTAHPSERDRGGRVGCEAARTVEGSRCVEILGFDFMIDASLKPWLIEVNHLPSFATDSPLDARIKSQVVRTALSVLQARAEDRKCFEGASKRDARHRLYRSEIRPGATLREQERRETEALVATICRKAIPRRRPKLAGFSRA